MNLGLILRSPNTQTAQRWGGSSSLGDRGSGEAERLFVGDEGGAGRGRRLGHSRFQVGSRRPHVIYRGSGGVKNRDFIQ